MKNYLKLQLFLLLILPLKILSATVGYQLSFPEPHTHYVEVTMNIDNLDANAIDLKMPVWAPGSYLVREFSRHVDSFSAFDNNGNVLEAVKVNKNTWRLSTEGKKNLRIVYKVYAYELSVRTSFIDQEHAYLNGSSIFMYCEKFMNLPLTVKVVPFTEWKTISVALNKVNDTDNWYFKAANYDDLVDAPFEIGNHVVFSFVAAGVPHEVAMVGAGNYDVERIKTDFKKIIEESTGIYGEHPCQKYLFIIHNLSTGGGGLEHANSTTLQTNRWSYGSESGYRDFLSLVAHEYFHLWNVKRLRPVPLGPFDYSNENYTTLLWVAEGFTAYYDDLLIRRCGFSSDTEYLKILAGSMSYCTNIKGGNYQSLSESSLDAWIKYYRPSENSSNATVSYYTKGSVVAALLDLEIRAGSNNQKSLDDVMKSMYALYYKKLNRAYTQKDFVEMVNKVAGKDLSGFFKKYVDGTSPLPLMSYIGYAGLDLVDLNAIQDKAWTGLTTTATNSRITVTAIERNSPAWKCGINVNDEILALDQFRVLDDLSKYLSLKVPGEKVLLTLSRGGILKEIEMTLEKTSSVIYGLEKKEHPSEREKVLYQKWLKL